MLSGVIVVLLQKLAVSIFLLLLAHGTVVLAQQQSMESGCPTTGPDGQTSDEDGDRVVDGCDQCPGSPMTTFPVTGETSLIVDSAGCAFVQACPCDGPRTKARSWKNRGSYVHCTKREVHRLHREGHLDRDEARQLLAGAKASKCGRHRRRPGDSDGDGILDDGDGDGFAGDHPCRGGNTEHCDDNCVHRWNPKQRDTDGNGKGDKCDPDMDGDGIPNGDDNCPLVKNPDQKDDDDDGVGNACDQCPGSDPGDDVDSKGCK